MAARLFLFLGAEATRLALRGQTGECVRYDEQRAWVGGGLESSPALRFRAQDAWKKRHTAVGIVEAFPPAHIPEDGTPAEV